MQRHGTAGWLERRMFVPPTAGGDDGDGVAAEALLFACAHDGGGASVRAAVRDVRLYGPDGALKAVLLDGDAPATDE